MASYQENRMENGGITDDNEQASRNAAETPDRTEASAAENPEQQQLKNTTGSMPEAVNNKAQKLQPKNAKRTTKFFQDKVHQVIRYGHCDFVFTRSSSIDNIDDKTINPWGPFSAKDVIASILSPPPTDPTRNRPMQSGVGQGVL